MIQDDSYEHLGQLCQVLAQEWTNTNTELWAMYEQGAFALALMQMALEGN